MTKICDGFTIGTVLASINEVLEEELLFYNNVIIICNIFFYIFFLIITYKYHIGNDYKTNNAIKNSSIDTRRINKCIELKRSSFLRGRIRVFRFVYIFSIK